MIRLWNKKKFKNFSRSLKGNVIWRWEKTQNSETNFKWTFSDSNFDWLVVCVGPRPFRSSILMIFQTGHPDSSYPAISSYAQATSSLHQAKKKLLKYDYSCWTKILLIVNILIKYFTMLTYSFEQNKLTVYSVYYTVVKFHFQLFALI